MPNNVNYDGFSLGHKASQNNVIASQRKVNVKGYVLNILCNTNVTSG